MGGDEGEGWGQGREGLTERRGSGATMGQADGMEEGADRGEGKRGLLFCCLLVA